MPSPVDQALSSLLPTLSPLPVELVDLATSLLAQSRSRTSTLKPEEEIGRTYACCHIACERLGKKLALEIGKPAPPVQPRVYTKLKTYLGSILRTPSTPKGRGRVEDKLATTPGRGGSAVQITTTTTTTTTTTPVVEGRRETRRSAQATPTRGAVIVVAAPVSSRKRKAEQEVGAVELVNAVPVAVMVLGQEHEEKFDEDAGESNDDAVKTVAPVKRPSKTPLRRKEKHAKFDDKVEDLEAAGLLPGLGTMFQPAIDWLGDDRRAQYAIWRDDILREISVFDVEMT